MDRKIVAVAAISILVVAATCVAIIALNDDDDEDKYDASKGWYSWNPITLETKTAYFTTTPLIVTGIEKMYNQIYGGDVDYSKYNASDIPADFLSFTSLVKERSEDTVTITSTVRDNSANSQKVEIDTVVPKCPDNLLTTSGYAAVLYSLLEMKYGSEAAEAKLWEYVFALDKSSFPGKSADFKALYGINVPSDIISVNSTYNLIDNMEKYTDYVDDGTADGRTFVMFAGVLGNDYSELKPFYNLLNSKDGRAEAVFYFANGIPDVLAAYEAVGAIYDLDAEAQKFIQDVRLKLYAINQEASNADNNYTVYLESNTGSACGQGTITNDAFRLLCLTNINTADQWQKISEETIIGETPDVIIFYDTNTKSWDERMHVSTATV